MIPKPPKDKRTREYKEWFKKYGDKYEPGKTKGVGDVVETVAEPIAKLLKLKDDCGCEERKQALNKVFRFSYGRKALRCITPEQAEFWGEFSKKLPKKEKDFGKTPVTPEEKTQILDIGKHIFAVDETSRFDSCGSCKKYLLIDINRIYKS